MSIFEKLFTNTKNTAEPGKLYAPARGKVIPLGDIPDPAFSSGALGPGCGIVPDGDEIYAPTNGVILSFARSLHAIGIETDDGAQILIHAGIDTVMMNGNGFCAHAKVKQRTKKGQRLLSINREKIRLAGYSDIVCITVTNAEDMESVDFTNLTEVKAGDELARYSTGSKDKERK